MMFPGATHASVVSRTGITWRISVKGDLARSGGTTESTMQSFAHYVKKASFELENQQQTFTDSPLVLKPVILTLSITNISPVKDMQLRPSPCDTA